MRGEGGEGQSGDDGKREIRSRLLPYFLATALLMFNLINGTIQIHKNLSSLFDFKLMKNLIYILSENQINVQMQYFIFY